MTQGKPQEQAPSGPEPWARRSEDGRLPMENAPAGASAASRFAKFSVALDRGFEWMGRHERWTVPAVLVLLAALAYPDVFLKGRAIAPADLVYCYSPWKYEIPRGIVPASNPVLSDQFDMFIPVVKYARECLLRGEIPYWCDKMQNGTPFFFIIKHEVMVLPLMLLTILFDVPIGMTLYFLLRHILGGLFFYKYVRILGLGGWASLCATVVFSYCKYSVQDFIFPMHLELMLVPMIAYGVERIIRDRSLLWCAALPPLIATNLVSGFPAGSVYCLYLLTAYTGYRILWQSGRRLALIGWFAGLYGMAVLMAAPALLATADFFSGFDWSYRSGYWGWSLPLAGLITWIFPYFYGQPYLTALPLGSWYENCIYIGLLPLLALVASLFSSRLTAIRFFFLAFAAWLIAVVYNVGQILEHVVRHIPLLNSNPNTRQKMILAFVLAVLLAYALNDLGRRCSGVWRRRLAMLLVLPILGWAAWKTWDYYAIAAMTPFIKRRLVIQAVQIAAALGVLYALHMSKSVRAGLKIAVFVLIVADLQIMDKGWFHHTSADRRLSVGWNPTIHRKAFYPETEGIKFLSANLGEHKMFTLDAAFLANTPLYFGLNNVSGRGFFDSRTKQLYRLLNEDALGPGQSTQFLFDSSRRTRLNSPLFDALGIKYVVLDSRRVLEDLSRDYVVKQVDWNSEAAVAPGQTIRQTFVAPRSLKADFLTLNVAQESFTADPPLELRLEDVTTGEAQHWGDSEWRPVTRSFMFHLGGFEFTAGHTYAMDLTAHRDLAGDVRLLCARNVDVLRSGSVFQYGQAQPIDLMFSIYADQGPDYLLRQAEGDEQLRLEPGQELAQTFRSGRSMRPDRCEIQVSSNDLADKSRAWLTIHDLTEDTVFAPGTAEWIAESSTLSFDLKGFAAAAHHEYQLRLSVPRTNGGSLGVSCMIAEEAIPGGRLSVNGVGRPGALTCSLFIHGEDDRSKFRIVYDKGFTILENTRAYPRAWLVGGLRYESPDRILTGLSDNDEDLRRCVWVEDDMRNIAGEPRVPSQVEGRVEAKQLLSSYQQFETVVGVDCYMVVGDNYDHGWRARIDGEETSVFRADYNLRGIRLPKGRHVVEFVYRPPHFFATAAISIGATLCFVIVLIRARVRRTRAAGLPDQPLIS